MKLADLGLKTKPTTKNFDHGYISFKTENKNLFYLITIFDEKKDFSKLTNEWHLVESKEHFNQLMSIKTRKEVVQ